MQHKNSNSLPLPVLIVGGAVLGFVGAWVLVNLLANLAWIAGPIIGALWGFSLYKPRTR